jgi:acyl-coenzyme A thioesterase PaaI-like protein
MIDFKLTYLRSVSVKSGTISAEGKGVKLGRQTTRQNRCSFPGLKLLLYD